MREPSRSFARSRSSVHVVAAVAVLAGLVASESCGSDSPAAIADGTSDAGAGDGGAPSLDGMTAMDTGASADTSIVGQADAESTDATSADARSSDASDAAAVVDSPTMNADAYAPPGALDPAFADRGLALVPLAGGSAFFRDALPLAGGDLVVVGGADNKMVAARFHENGSADTTFANSGSLPLAVLGTQRSIRSSSARTGSSLLPVRLSARAATSRSYASMPGVCPTLLSEPRESSLPISARSLPIRPMRWRSARGTRWCSPDTPRARRTTSPLLATTRPGCSIRLLARVA